MALGVTAIHTSPPHHFEHVRSLLHVRLSSIPVVLSLPYAFPVSPFIYYYSLCFGSGSIAGSIYCSGYLFLDCLAFRRVYLFSWVRMLTLGLTVVYAPAWSDECGESFSGSAHPSLALIKWLIRVTFGVHFRAELSSNPSFTWLRGSTTAKGLYANICFVLTHYAFGGVSAQCVLLALSTPLRPRGRTGVFRRREGPASPVHLGHPLLPALALWVSSCTRRLLTPRCAACGSTLPMGPLSLLRLLRHPSCGHLSACITCSGADGRAFPSATAGGFQDRIPYLLVVVWLFRGVDLHQGGRMSFPAAIAYIFESTAA